MPGVGESFKSTRQYRGFRLDDVVYRPGALAVLKYPSRYSNLLVYPKLFVKES